MTPLMLQILMHYYHTVAEYVEYNDAVDQAHESLAGMLLIDRNKYGICTITTLGRQHVDTLVSISLPTAQLS